MQPVLPVDGLSICEQIIFRNILYMKNATHNILCVALVSNLFFYIDDQKYPFNSGHYAVLILYSAWFSLIRQESRQGLRRFFS